MPVSKEYKRLSWLIKHLGFTALQHLITMADVYSLVYYLETDANSQLVFCFSNFLFYFRCTAYTKDANL